eukprot:scaffold7847_cov135-Isochrysis_galbana.AAC.1
MRTGTDKSYVGYKQRAEGEVGGRGEARPRVPVLAVIDGCVCNVLHSAHMCVCCVFCVAAARRLAAALRDEAYMGMPIWLAREGGLLPPQGAAW